jgi:hypothetical protein
MRLIRIWSAFVAPVFASVVAHGAGSFRPAGAPVGLTKEAGFVGYWKLRGDCRDCSGHGYDGVHHGVNLDNGAFDGRSAVVEIANNASLKFGTGDSALCAWIYTEKELDDVLGVSLCIWESNDLARRLITLYGGAAFAWNPECPLAKRTLWVNSGRRQRLDREMINWQLIFPDATSNAIDADRGPEVKAGRYVWPLRAGKPIVPTMDFVAPKR